MTDAVLSQIEQILQGIETRTEHAKRCLGYDGCICDWQDRVRAEIARTVERMIAEVRTEDPADSIRKRNDAFLAASVRAAGGTPT